ncbi:MAG: hypothetical protein Q7V88_09175 [Actinomycetota bacterium]|nr:hypothetical protein [Actinomycetota bacterium]
MLHDPPSNKAVHPARGKDRPRTKDIKPAPTPTTDTEQIEGGSDAA